MLKDVLLFAGMSDADLATLEELATTKTYPRNTVIISEGDTSDSLYGVLSGKLKVYLSDDEGKEIIINILNGGDYFGELALIDEEPRSASVMTSEETRLAVIPKSTFEETMSKNPEMALIVIKGLVSRLRNLTENVKSLALMDVYGRVARTLLDLADDEGGKKVITQRLTQRDIANMVGASREMVSRILKDLTVGGYISIKNKTITIEEKLPAAW